VANGYIRRHLDSARQETVLRPLDDFENTEISVSCGAVKAGLIYADEPHFLLNRQFQIIPFLF